MICFGCAILADMGEPHTQEHCSEPVGTPMQLSGCTCQHVMNEKNLAAAKAAYEAKYGQKGLVRVQNLVLDVVEEAP